MYDPNWQYHEMRAPMGKLIKSEKEEAELIEDGWVDTPAKFACNVPTATEALPMPPPPPVLDAPAANVPPPVIPTLPGRRKPR